jgi:hypothetical protein
VISKIYLFSKIIAKIKDTRFCKSSEREREREREKELTIPARIPARCTWSFPRCIPYRDRIDPSVVPRRSCRCRIWRSHRRAGTSDAVGFCRMVQRRHHPDRRNRRPERRVSRCRRDGWRPLARRSSTSCSHKLIRADRARLAPLHRCSWRSGRMRSDLRGWRCHSRADSPCWDAAPLSDDVMQ